jgi:hypothetical protein
MTNTAGLSPKDVDSHSRLSINYVWPSDRVRWGSGLVPSACSTKPKGRIDWNSGYISAQNSRNATLHTCESGDNPLLTSLLIRILRHLIEPRFDEFKSASEKEKMLSSMSIRQDISLQPFQQALGSTKMLSAGGYGPDNFAETISSGASDLVAFGRYFM